MLTFPEKKRALEKHNKTGIKSVCSTVWPTTNYTELCIAFHFALLTSRSVGDDFRVELIGGGHSDNALSVLASLFLVLQLGFDASLVRRLHRRRHAVHIVQLGGGARVLAVDD